MGFRRNRAGLVIVASLLSFLFHRLYVSKTHISQHSSPDDEEQYRGAVKHAQDILGPPAVFTGSSPWSRTSESPLPQVLTAAGQLYPIVATQSLPALAETQLPKIQCDFPTVGGNGVGKQEARLSAVKEAFQHSWQGYKDFAWLDDELAPVTAGHRQTFGRWAATLVDSLDTLWLMGMTDDFEEAVKAIEDIDFRTTEHLPINVFETTIRYLGGLLGAYDVSNARYPTLLTKAIEAADMLYGAFDTPNRMPITRWSKISVEVASGETMIAELGSLSLEFTRLSQLTGDMRYYDAISRITDCISSQQMNTKLPGLLPQIVNARECDFSQNPSFTLGAISDSAYEYMVKEHQLLKGSTTQYATLWNKAVGPMKEHILFRPRTSQNLDILMAGTMKSFKTSKFLEPQVQHLSCFAGGMFALASKLFDTPEDLETGVRLTEGCIWAYNATQTGIMPELFHVVPCGPKEAACTWDESLWSHDLLAKNSYDESPADKQRPMKERMALKEERLHIPKGMTAMASREYRLRPEAIESVFVLYRITRNEYYREIGWKMFEAITKYTRTEFGFSSIEDVTVTSVRKLDKMESFWTAETLKYFWLLFEDENVMSLDEWVLSTEAHGFKLDWKG